MARTGAWVTVPLLLALAGFPGVRCAGAASASSQAPEITIYAAASLREALEDLVPHCQKVTGAKLVLNLGASSDLARQIEAAGKADLFFSADESLVDRLSRAGLVLEDTRRSLLSNRLVVIGPVDGTLAIHTAADLAGGAVRHLSLANPEAVPAGKYARAWLEKAGQWQAVKDRVVPGVDVRAALACVEAGVAEAGIVYATDAAISKRVRILLEAPLDQAPLISYPLAVLRDRPQEKLARRVASCIEDAEAARIFQNHGFGLRTTAP